MSDARLEITYAEATLADMKGEYLRSNGWRYCCGFPGSIWLWQKPLPDGLTIVAVQEAAAIMMQNSWPGAV